MLQVRARTKAKVIFRPRPASNGSLLYAAWIHAHFAWVRTVGSSTDEIPRATQREIVSSRSGATNRLRVEGETPSINLGTMLEMTVSLRNDEVRTLAFGGVGADPDGATCRLNQVLHINVPEGEFVSAYGEVNPL